MLIEHCDWFIPVRRSLSVNGLHTQGCVYAFRRIGMLKMGNTIIRWTFAITLGLAAIAPTTSAQDEMQPTATITYSDMIPDTEAVLSLSRWVPLFRIEMAYSSDEGDMQAPRALAQLQISIIPDPGNPKPYPVTFPAQADIEEFAIFREDRSDDDLLGILDARDFFGAINPDDPFDFGFFTGPLHTWDVFGIPNDTTGPTDDLNYILDFPSPPPAPGTPPPINMIHNVNPGDPTAGHSYIVAFRTSANMPSTTSFGYRVTGQIMLDEFGVVPVNDMFEPIDSISPDFSDSDNQLRPDTSYASSFDVLDMNGGSSQIFQEDDYNNWNWPIHMYTPLAEHRRPRFDVAGAVFDFVTGEWLELRRLVSLDAWTAVLGINAHSTSHVETFFNGTSTFYPFVPPEPASLIEVNLIMTDVGGDPLGPPGNGGFNPTEGLETSTSEIYAPGQIDAAFAAGPDVVFNGAWVFHDTNNNFLFDPPQPAAGGGVNIIDRPLFPFDFFEFPGPNPPDDVVPGLPLWEHIPMPPGGGDPWWKIRLRFDEGNRRNIADPNDDPPTGHLEPTIDTRVDQLSTMNMDYFVAIRPDAGYFDTSLLPPDGTAMTMGADFRTFIEPRRIDPNTGSWDGGIFFDAQWPDRGLYIEGQQVLESWQNHPFWDTYNPGEPWWPQRSHNADVARVWRSGVEIHDLVLTYESNNAFAQDTDIQYGDGGYFSTFIGPTQWSSWLDPFGLLTNEFFYPFDPGVLRFQFDGTGGFDDNRVDSLHYPYETAGFFNPIFDGTGPFAPRSNFFPFPPAQPSLPLFGTWPGASIPGFLGVGELPMEEQWNPNNRRARFLRQRIGSGSTATALLGINMAGADDPVTNQNNGVFMKRVTVAFWGPGFNPHAHLQQVDLSGTSALSGVALIEDTSADGVFGNGFSTIDATTLDQAVPVQNLAFRPNPEPIDVDGDGIPDDMNGDGVYTAGLDDAWVVRLAPTTPWPVPVRDATGGNVGGIPREANSNNGEAPVFTAAEEPEDQPVPRPVGTEYWTAIPEQQDQSIGAVTKAIGPTGNPGDDLFVVVRTSDFIPRGQLFRAIVPATLPGRPVFDRVAGVEMTPQTPISAQAYAKSHPEESPPERYYGVGRFGVDMIEANVGVRLDAAVAPNDIFADSGNVPVMKIDLSTNRGDFTGIADSSATSGALGVGAPGSFVVPGVSWAPGIFTNFFLVDSSYESFEITGNNSNTLFLRTSGNVLDAPLNGQWVIARSPSFFEQLVVEFYDEGNDGGFDLLEDLLPLQIDPTLSGIKLYRDNDFNPGNVNGEFDPGDIPVPLDYAPYQIGQPGEPSFQVMFDFSSPGTDDIGPGGVAATLASQFPHNRQWVQDSFGISTSDPNFGADFFIVICTSDRIQIGDDFRVGIVSWGANTDTLPDPNTFPPPPISQVGEFDIFSEFPWGSRALGFITFSYSGSTLYKAYPDPDISGFSWVRSTTSNAEQTSIITTVQRVVQPDDLVITDVSPVLLTKITAAVGATLSIEGVNFGASPTVMMDSLALAVTASTPTSITAVIAGGTIIDNDNDGVVTLRVTDPATAKTDTFSGFTIINADPATTPTITAVTPASGDSTVFPVTVIGTNFDNPTVLFGSTVMPVASFTTTTIVLNFPIGGLPATGPLDVTVVNFSGLFAIATDAFTFINAPGGGGGGGGGGFGPGGGLPTAGCFIATAAFDGTQERELTALREFRDDVLLKSAFGAAFIDAYYAMSPPIADAVADRPWMAKGVRVMLTPIARTVEQPAWLGLPLGMLAAGMIAGRARRRSKALSR